MRILLIHNYYQQPGGEDKVFSNEMKLLEKAGHDVTVYTKFNDEINTDGLVNKISLLKNTIWSTTNASNIGKIIKDKSPDVAHFTNTFPLISPAAYYSCVRASVPVVQTLQNYRLVCPSAKLLRDGKVCLDCIKTNLPWPSVWHACYRDSRMSSFAVASMLAIHRYLKTWHDKVDLYVSATEFSRQKLIEGGLPADKIVVKPNFLISDPGERLYDENKETYGLFVGRLSPEKGLSTLLKAWSKISDLELKIVGDGPLFDEMNSFILRNKMNNVQLQGRCSEAEVVSLMKGAAFLLFTSEWFEGFPMTIVESFACGLPVIASKIGAAEEVITDKYSGLHYECRNSDDLVSKVNWAMDNRFAMKEFGHNARLEYEKKYTAKRNYELLMSIYDIARNTK